MTVHDAGGEIYVTDALNHRVQVFDSSGNYLRQWGKLGGADGDFVGPTDVAIDAAGDVYVLDGNPRVQKFDSAGNSLFKWGSGGAGDGQFNLAQGICIAPNGNVYVADARNHRVQEFDGCGNFLSSWGGLGSGDGQMSNVHDVAAKASGNLVVADRGNVRMQEFGTAPFTLAASKRTFAVGDNISIRHFGGVPGELARLYVWTVDGVLMRRFAMKATLDGSGTWPLDDAVPASISGSELQLISLSKDAQGKPVVTGLEPITVQ